MWIKEPPSDCSNHSSSIYGNLFLWREGNTFVMDNHKSALWCWLQSCDPTCRYNFMHLDRHYDLQDSFEDSFIEPLRTNPHMPFEDYCNLRRERDSSRVFSWDNYLMAGFSLCPDWFHTNIFITHKVGDKDPFWGHQALEIREEDPLFMESNIQQFIGEPSEFLDAFRNRDFELPWIVNLDLDVFYTGNSHIQLFSDEYIRRVAENLQSNLSNIASFTIAISPDCLGGNDLQQKWEQGFRLISIMSEKIVNLRVFLEDYQHITTTE